MLKYILVYRKDWFYHRFYCLSQSLRGWGTLTPLGPWTIIAVIDGVIMGKSLPNIEINNDMCRQNSARLVLLEC